ncbi:uncharacterized protein TNIN_158821 [Trichonephila inaurata madagascariensis]|uniref:Uncharacterized protein n=1 Tax=Trichonephila inaurata madagascariensis TaxID=2747483 RepID=A0A8X6XNS1_9ARAC|nr:uncharacterized protein TNIN_158821 [Trichonephila inaurata madagascariensis]
MNHLRVILIIGCTAGFLYKIYFFLLYYWTYPVVIDIQTSEPVEFPIPAITFCNSNGIIAVKFCRLGELCLPFALVERVISCKHYVPMCEKFGYRFPKDLKNLSKNDPSVSLQATLNVKNDQFNNSINESSVNSKRNVNSVRLPKLQIDKYFDDPCLWLEFWNKFQNSIDKNETLTKVDKFSYLKSLLGGVAGNVINGFVLSDDNYVNALILLKERFGREETVVYAHMSKLLNLYPVKDSNNVIGLRKLYDIYKIQIRSLESLNVTSGMRGHLLQPIRLKLLPEDLVLDFNRKHN